MSESAHSPAPTVDRFDEIRQSVRLVFTDLAIWGTLFGLGLALLTLDHRRWGWPLMISSFLYLLFMVLTARPIYRNVPRALRFSLGLFACVLAGLATMLAAGKLEPKLTRNVILWAAVYLALHIICLAIYSKRGQGIALKFRAQYGRNPAMSVIFVPLCFAAVGLLYWWGINKIYDKAFTLAAPPVPRASHPVLQPAPTEQIHVDDGASRTSPMTARAKHPKESAIPAADARPLERQENRHPNSAQNSTRQPPPVFIETAPAFGNIADRASALADQIMEDLYRHGWDMRNEASLSPSQRSMIQSMPTTSEGLQQWTQSRSGYFRFRFFDKVLELRNEFAQLHIRDERLDDFFKYQGMIEQANKRMAAANISQRMESPILPQEIEEVAERLRVLAKQVPVQRSAPRPLPFTVTKVRPEKPEFPFEIVITIQTEKNVQSGYIAVEFDGQEASIATDFVGSRLVTDQDQLIGNKPLLEYVRSHDPGDIYLLEIGNVPFTTKKPIHVISYGSTEFRVLGVTLFEK